MRPESVVRHVRDYPRWYAAGVTWLVLMIVLPVVGVDIVPAFAAPAVQQQPAAAEVAAPSTGAPAPPPAPVAPQGPAAPAQTDLAPTTTVAQAPSESPPPEIIPPEELPPGFFDPFFDVIPGLPAIDTPEELMPLYRAVAPIATHGCTATGLAAIVLAVVAPSVEGVPLERLLPYLSPVTSACANFPIPKTHTECELDQPFIIDLGGLAMSPPIIGMGIDAIEAFETELIATYGVGVPRVSGSLRETLNCEVVTV